MEIVDFFAMNRAACFFTEGEQFKKHIKKCVALARMYKKHFGKCIFSDARLPGQKAFWGEYYEICSKI